MKKRIVLFLLSTLVSLFVFTGCGEGGGLGSSTGGGQSVHTHTDGDENGICDGCAESVLITLDFYSINDLHGKIDDTYANIGVDEMTAYLRKAQTENENTVVLSAGDMWQGSAESNFTKGKLVTDWMNEMDFAAMAMGNHEFDWGESYIESNEAIAEFPFLGINVYDKDTNQRVEYCQPSVTIEKGGVQIGIIGAIGDCYSSIAQEQVEDIYFKVDNELTALVKAESQKLRAAGADLIVYILHDAEVSNRNHYDEELSNGYVDLVFEGHSHTTVLGKDKYGVWHLQAGGDNAQGLSHARVAVNTVSGDFSVRKAQIVEHSAYQNMTDDPLIDQLLEKYADELSKVNEVLGQNDEYRSYQALAESAARALYVAGEERWGDEAAYEGKIVLGGGYLNVRSPGYLPVGEVTYGDIYPLFPFDNLVTLCAVSGERLQRQFLQSTNYYCYYGEYGEWVKENLDYEETYYVVVDTYCANYNFQGMGNMTIVEYYDATNKFFTRDALAAFIKDGGFGTPAPDPDPDDGYTAISEIHAQSAACNGLKVKGRVVAVSGQSFLFSDGTGVMMFYTGSAPAISVGETVEIQGNTSVYASNQQFKSDGAEYTVKNLEVPAYTTPTAEKWGSAEVESFDGLIGKYVELQVSVYKSGNYYNCLELSNTSERTVSLIAPADEVLGDIVISDMPQDVVITGYPCYVTGGRYLNILVDSMTLIEEKEEELQSFSLSSGFGGNSISQYATGNYGYYTVNGVTLEFYRAYTPSGTDYITELLPYFASAEDGTAAGALYNTSPIYGIQSIEITYKSEDAAMLYTGDDRVAEMTAHSLSQSSSYRTATIEVDTDNFFKIDSGDSGLFIQALTIEYTGETVSYNAVKKSSGEGDTRLNATTFNGTLVAGQSSVSVPVKVEYDGGSYFITQAKTYTYYTLEYVEANPSFADEAAITSAADIAAYYAAFKQFPANFAAKNFDGNSYSEVHAVFGDDTRYVSKYSRTNGYAQYVPYNDNNTVYYEFDVALDSSYWSGGGRGVGRVVSWEAGWVSAEYDDAPVSVYTDDHYATFQEYLNNGEFGERFDAEKNLTFIKWTAPDTVTAS